MCRSSALYATLEGDEMYEHHLARPEPDSTDWVILSPEVPVFRDDAGVALERTWTLDVITSAAPVAHRVGQPKSGDLLQRRIHRVLEVAASQSSEVLVLGAWGCGAFGNDPLTDGTRLPVSSRRRVRRRVPSRRLRDHGLVAGTQDPRPVPGRVPVSDREHLDGSPMTSARDRAGGALVGLAVGDAVGTTLEFKTPGSFTPITDMVGGGPFRLRAGAWTDDTSMAMCLAESILDRGELDPVDQLTRYVRWYRDGYWSSTGACFDIGTTTRRALSRFEVSGEVVDPQPDEDAAANGSLMRLAAVPIRWHADTADAAERSGESSRTTHPATRPTDACRVLGAMIAALIGGASAGEVLAPDFWQFGPLHPEVEAVARGSWLSKQPPAIRGTGYSVDALEAALWAVGGAADFRDAVLRAANLGDDADTTAAIAGQLAGARWGLSGIPVEWRERIVSADRIAAIAGRLYDAGVAATRTEVAARRVPPRLVGRAGRCSRGRVPRPPRRRSCGREGQPARRLRRPHVRRSHHSGRQARAVRTPRDHRGKSSRARRATRVAPDPRSRCHRPRRLRPHRRRDP